MGLSWVFWWCLLSMVMLSDHKSKDFYIFRHTPKIITSVIFWLTVHYFVCTYMVLYLDYTLYFSCWHSLGMADTTQDQLPNGVLVGTLPHISNAVQISHMFTPGSKVLYFHFPYNMKGPNMSSWYFIITCKRKQLQQMRVLPKSYYWLEIHKRTAIYWLRSPL